MQKGMLFLLVAAVALASCSDNYKKTKSGLVYKIKSGGSGPVAKKGQTLKFNFKQMVGDSVIRNTYDAMPIYYEADSTGPVYDITELFTSVRKGDSVVAILQADSIEKKLGQLPPFMKKGDKMTLSLRVIEIFDNAQLAMADRSNEVAKRKDPQIKAFNDYMASRKDRLQKTPNGTYVEVKSQGDGPQVEPGKQVSVLYTGKLIPTEKVFQSNVSPASGIPPIQFVIGDPNMIPGWNDGLVLFKKGGKGTLYIPQELAYGDQLAPAGMPFQGLIFDIEILDVTDAPKGPAPMPIPDRVPQGSDTTHNHK
jgi:FKBP-type peptidyl-prolyl cis-trans isomerase FkpA